MKKTMLLIFMLITSCIHPSRPDTNSSTVPQEKPIKYFEFTGTWKAVGQFKHFPIFYESSFENLYGQGEKFQLITRFCPDPNCMQILFTHTVNGAILGLAKNVNINLLSPGYSDLSEISLQVLASKIVTGKLNDPIKLDGMTPCGFDKLETNQIYQLPITNTCYGFFIFNEPLPTSIKISAFGDKFDFTTPISYGTYTKQKSTL